jgi:Ca-activated chloride channel family protein
MTPMTRKNLRQALILIALALVPLLATSAEAASRKERKEAIAALPSAYQNWLDEIKLLITKEEIDAFLLLEKDYQRDAFIEDFWRLRDPFPDTARNEFRERWDERVAEAWRLFETLDEDRSIILLLNGFPDARVPISCREMWPAEVWFFRHAENLEREAALLFIQRGALGKYVLWQPSDGMDDLYRSSLSGRGGVSFGLSAGCDVQEEEVLSTALRWAQSEGVLGFSAIVAGLTKTPDGPSGEWVATFNSYTTDLPADAESFEADLALEYPGRYKTRTVVQGLFTVSREQLAVADLGGHESYNVQLIGEVLRNDRLFDSFRYFFNHPASSISGERIPLAFERYLRPGEYTLILRLEDINGEKFFRTSRTIAVPVVETAVSRPPADPETARLLEEANAAIASGETTLKIIPPQGDLHTGMLRIDTISSGGEIAEVVFSIDGNQVLKKRDPPWSVEFDLGALPRMRTLTAVGFDRAGKEMVRDELTLNAGSHRFAVRLVEPRKGKAYKKSLRAQAEVEVPEGKVVEKVEFYLNEDLVATLYQEPWIQPILLPGEETVAYVRVVAYQPDGNSTEDLVFVNAPDYLEEVDVQFVELYVAALDVSQRPVDGLSENDFGVEEDGIPQTLLRFDHVANLPIHAGVLIDISASMIDRIDTAQLAALKFFQQAITPKDRATLITFNDHPNLVAKFTSDLGTLAGGLAGLKAERGTALHDSIIFALYYFNGIKGQRALIVLSDGQDEHSRFTFEDSLDYAKRAGVAVYAIGLDLSRKEREAKKNLRQLADETGGRLFLIEDAQELEGVYREIQRELRSRYYLAYQSSNTEDTQRFRMIEVDVAREGVEAKTLRGYYP